MAAHGVKLPLLRVWHLYPRLMATVGNVCTSRVPGADTKVWSAGPFDSLLGVRALITAFRREEGNVGREVEERKDSSSSPGCLFQTAVSLPGSMQFMLSSPALLVARACLGGRHEVRGQERRVLLLCLVCPACAKYFIRIPR